MNKVIDARFAGICPACGQRIAEGDPIVQADEGWVHAAACDDPASQQPLNELCRSCFIYHPGECA